MNGPDYYDILSVSRKASPAEIKAAYRAAMLKCHPDVNSAPNAQRLAEGIIDAYNVLSDPERRRAYDASLSAEQPLEGTLKYRTFGDTHARPTMVNPGKALAILIASLVVIVLVGVGVSKYPVRQPSGPSGSEAVLAAGTPRAPEIALAPFPLHFLPKRVVGGELDGMPLDDSGPVGVVEPQHIEIAAIPIEGAGLPVGIAFFALRAGVPIQVSQIVADGGLLGLDIRDGSVIATFNHPEGEEGTCCATHYARRIYSFADNQPHLESVAVIPNAAASSAKINKPTPMLSTIPHASVKEDYGLLRRRFVACEAGLTPHNAQSRYDNCTLTIAWLEKRMASGELAKLKYEEYEAEQDMQRIALAAAAYDLGRRNEARKLASASLSDFAQLKDNAESPDARNKATIWYDCLEHQSCQSDPVGEFDP